MENTSSERKEEVENGKIQHSICVRTVFSLLSFSLEEGAGEGQSGAALDDVHLELGFAAHLAQVWFVGVRIDFWFLLAVHRVVDIEANYHLFFVRLLAEFYIGSVQRDAESVKSARHSFSLLHLALGHDLLGEELNQLSLT